MNKTLLVSFIVIGVILLAAVIFGAGLLVGSLQSAAGGTGPFGMMGGANNSTGPYGMMGGYQTGASANAQPLTIDQARQAADNYLKQLNNPDLEVKEIMIFTNNAYVRITEKSTGAGAMELLVDPATLNVFPEYGPNMMWNLKYGPMSANGMMGGYGGMMGGNGGMMGNYSGSATPSVSGTMTVSPDQAVTIAQQYLDQQFPGSKASTDPDPFYGYYTIEILKDGNPTGMLSVNGFSGEVWLHTWHGTFIEVWE